MQVLYRLPAQFLAECHQVLIPFSDTFVASVVLDQ
jgi:hypothetical protein